MFVSALMSHEVILKTPRDRVEAHLIARFSPCIKPLEENIYLLGGSFKDTNDEGSMMALALFSHGDNRFSTSSNYTRGLVYYDGAVTFGVSVYFHEEDPAVPTFRLIAPRGLGREKVIAQFIRRIHEHMPEAQFAYADVTQ